MTLSYKGDISNLDAVHSELAYFQELYIMYDPTRQQVYLSNDSSSLTYDVQYVIYGNTAGHPSLPYTPLPAGAQGSIALPIAPGKNFYPGLNPFGLPDPLLNLPFINHHLFWQDLTVTDGKGATVGWELNNQALPGNINRILLQGVETSLS